MIPNDPSNPTDEGWGILAPFVPPTKHGGRHRTVDIRHVVSALRDRDRSGGAGCMLPKHYPPWPTVYFERWTKRGVWNRLNKQRVAFRTRPQTLIGAW